MVYRVDIQLKIVLRVCEIVGSLQFCIIALQSNLKFQGHVN